MSSAVLTALGIENEDLVHKIILISENGSCSGSFILSSIMDKQLSDNNNVLLVLFHNTVGHFQNISIKLGYNLMSKENKNFLYIDYLNKINSDSCLNSVIDCETQLSNLYSDIRKNLDILSTEGKKVCLVLENLNDLYFTSEQTSFRYFIHYIFGLVHDYTSLSIVTTIHEFEDDEIGELINNHLSNLSDMKVCASDLKTGAASDISGSFLIKRKGIDKNSWNVQNVFLFQLLDKNIKVFARGGS